MDNKEKIASLEAQMEAIDKQIAELKSKPQFEIGKWYHWMVHKSSYGILKFNGINGPNVKASIAFHECSGSFYSSILSDGYTNISTMGELATEEEVAKYFEKYANILGFKVGVTVDRKNLPGWRIMGQDKISEYYDIQFQFNHGGDEIFILGKRVIYCNGEWATIVKDESVKIHGYEVIKKGDIYEIGCKVVDYRFLVELKKMMEKNGFLGTSFGEFHITLDEINKIINLK